MRHWTCTVLQCDSIRSHIINWNINQFLISTIVHNKAMLYFCTCTLYAHWPHQATLNIMIWNKKMGCEVTWNDAFSRPCLEGRHTVSETSARSSSNLPCFCLCNENELVNSCMQIADGRQFARPGKAWMTLDRNWASLWTNNSFPV